MGMKPSEELKSKGWKRVAVCRGGFNKSVSYWTHPNHQPRHRGFFTTTGAMNHQKYVERVGYCSCIPKEFSLHA